MPKATTLPIFDNEEIFLIFVLLQVGHLGIFSSLLFLMALLLMLLFFIANSPSKLHLL